MNQINSKVWNILLPDEKVALGLQFVQDKSSWQAGEIMNKSHYKYLEINYRAKKFMSLFTEYFDLYDELIPDYIKGDRLVKWYFRLCLQERKKPGEAVRTINLETPIKKRELDERIIKDFEIWGDENNTHEFQMFHLIKDFDRWNNFRILPEPLREVSAFKRRVKNTYKRHVRMMGELPSLSIKKIKQLCKVPTDKYPKPLYLGVIDKGLWQVIKVKNNKVTRELLTSLSLYLFEEKELADKFIVAVHKYLKTTHRECGDGLDFWPIYRESIKKAVNYNEIQNITPHRKYLDMALKNLQFYNHEKNG